ncbi:MAG: hypothetical protein IPM42_21810 [Saprospiraceae bacterium]|nr:hypothetical protein [Saprospiraceae bacterium]
MENKNRSNPANNSGYKTNAGAKIPRHRLKELEMQAEAKMMVEKLNQFGKIRSETTIHNSMFELTIRGEITEIDSFLFETKIGIGTGRVFLRKQTGSYN